MRWGWVDGDIVCTLPCILLILLPGSEEEKSDEEEEEEAVEEKKASPAKEAPKAEDDVRLLVMVLVYCTSSTPYHKIRSCH